MSDLEQQAPRTIGKYQILGILGRGSLGMVYKALDPEIDRVVAIKTLRRIEAFHGESIESAIQRFKQEARAAGNLRHPKIVTVFEVSSESDLPFIVLDYIEGQPLDRILAASRVLSPIKAVHYLSQVAEGLDYAHRHNVVHRDIKPSNIWIDKDDNVFILDFGIAAQVGKITDEKVLGTPGYMAPEQILHEDIDARTDVFALAVVAYQCLTGKRPFAGEDYTAIFSNILNVRYLPVYEACADLPLAVGEVFERAFARNKADRQGSASTLLAELSAALGLDSERLASSPTTVSVGDKYGSSGAESGLNSPYAPVRPGALQPHEPVVGKSTRRSRTDRRPGDVFRQGEGPSKGDKPSEGHPVEHVKLSSRNMVLGVLAGFLFVVIGVLLFNMLAGGGKRPADMDPGNGVLSSNPSLEEVAMIPLPKVEQPTIGTGVHEMGDREVLGLLLQPDTSEAMIIDGIKEASERRLADFPSVSQFLLRQDSYVVRLATLKALLDYQDKRVVPIIVMTLDDRDPVVRLEAANVLSKLGDRRALGYLIARYDREPEQSVKAAIQAGVDNINGFPTKLE